MVELSNKISTYTRFYLSTEGGLESELIFGFAVPSGCEDSEAQTLPMIREQSGSSRRLAAEGA